MRELAPARDGPERRQGEGDGRQAEEGTFSRRDRGLLRREVNVLSARAAGSGPPLATDTAMTAEKRRQAKRRSPSSWIVVSLDGENLLRVRRLLHDELGPVRP